VRYLNCGDWVESCTALAEDESGRIHLIRWQAAAAAQTTVPALPGEAPAIALPALLCGVQEPGDIIINSPPKQLGQSFAAPKRLARPGTALPLQGRDDGAEFRSAIRAQE
jgi:hypothetical protein